MKTLQTPAYVGDSKLSYGFFDDLEWLVTVHRWTTLVADAGTSFSLQAADGGRAALGTAATDNNEAAFFLSNEIFRFRDDGPLLYEARIQFTEANTDDANVACGFSSEFAANLLQDNGAGPAATQSCAMLYKVDGETVWRFVTSLSTTQTITQSTTTAGGASFQTLSIEVNAISSTQVECVPKVNGVQLLQNASGTLVPIKHLITYASAAQMGVGSYVKAGGGTAETLVTDYVSAWQKR